VIRFPLADLLDEQKCYNYLLHVLHPDGLKCPAGHPLPADQAPHDRHRDPIFDYRCRICGKVFNLFTGAVWWGTHYDCSTIVMIMRGFIQGTTTLQLAEELDLDYGTLLERRHRIQRLGLEHLPTDPLPDEETEADEMFQNAGEKGQPHHDPDDPPRRRANKRRGLGTMDNDRPPILGVVGRTSGQIRLRVCDNTQQATIQPQVEAGTEATTTLYTDESSAYNHIAETGRGHATVCHSQKEWARDDDGDGVREVHCNTMEGIWTGLRNFLRPFRGLHKKYLALYVAMFQGAHNLKRVTTDFLRTLMVPSFTFKPI
jgi:transposase-like protein